MTDHGSSPFFTQYLTFFTQTVPKITSPQNKMASKKGISPHSQIYLDLIKVKESSTIKPHNLLNYKDQTLPRMQTPTSSSSATASRSASEDEAVKRPANLEKIRLREAKDKLRLFVHQDLVDEDMLICFAEGKSGGDSKNKKNLRKWKPSFENII